MSVLSSSFRVCLFFKDLMIASFFVTPPSQIPKRVKKTATNSEISVFTGKYFKYMCS